MDSAMMGAEGIEYAKRRFRENWGEAKGYGHKAIEHAWQAGQALAEVKAKSPYGTWETWLKGEGLSWDTARRLMQLASIENPQLADFDSMTAALKSLPKASKPEIRLEDTAPVSPGMEDPVPQPVKEEAPYKPSKKEIAQIEAEQKDERLQIAETEVGTLTNERDELRERVGKILADEPEDSIKTKIWDEAEGAKQETSNIRQDLAIAGAHLEDAKREIRRLKNQRGRIKNALLDGVNPAEILAKYFGVEKK